MTLDHKRIVRLLLKGESILVATQTDKEAEYHSQECVKALSEMRILPSRITWHHACRWAIGNATIEFRVARSAFSGKTFDTVWFDDQIEDRAIRNVLITKVKPGGVFHNVPD